MYIENDYILYFIDPCARVNCNHGRCEIERGAGVCRCYQGYTGHDCLTPLGTLTFNTRFWAAPFCFLVYQYTL